MMSNERQDTLWQPLPIVATLLKEIEAKEQIISSPTVCFQVRYLPASTIGISLVQPTTSMAWLRTDKEARECTTDQFGPEKAALVAQARSVVGVVLLR